MSRGNRMWMHQITGGVAVLMAIAVSLGVTALPSTAKFTRSDTSAGTFSSDTLKPVTGLSATSPAYDQVKLSWTASPSTYVTGYKVQSSESSSGPWTQIGTTGSRTTTTFTDTGTGLTMPFYRVDAIYRNWIGPGAADQAPPGKGTYFQDSFNTEYASIDGQATQDGNSVWDLWNGGIRVAGSHAWGIGGGYSFAVVKTAPFRDVRMFAADLNGSEALIVRAKDAINYTWVGGNRAAGSFEVAEVRNGVRTVLKSTTLPGGTNIRFRLIDGIMYLYKDAIDVDSGGTLFMQVTTDYLSTDPAANNYGVGFLGIDYALEGVEFKALPGPSPAFTDGFDNTVQTDIDGQVTDTGDSVWKVLTGQVTDGRNSGAYGVGSTLGIAVVDTPTQNARITARTVDGIEAIVARAVDGNNYVWVGGNGTPGSLEVAEVRNGVRTVLQSTTIAAPSNIRLEVVGHAPSMRTWLTAETAARWR
jgi:hypothetical protein